jgi:hypothetical protein
MLVSLRALWIPFLVRVLDFEIETPRLVTRQEI